MLGIGEPLIGKLLLYNALDMSFEFVKLRKNPNCKVCGPNPEVTELIDYEAFCGVPGHDHDEGSVGGELGYHRPRAGGAHAAAATTCACWMCASRTSWKSRTSKAQR